MFSKFIKNVPSDLCHRPKEISRKYQKFIELISDSTNFLELNSDHLGCEVTVKFLETCIGNAKYVLVPSLISFQIHSQFCKTFFLPELTGSKREYLFRPKKIFNTLGNSVRHNF